MIEFIHKYPILIKVLLTVTTVAFVGTGGYFLGQDTVLYAARVGDEKITLKEYQDAVYNLESFYRKIYQGNIPEDLFKSFNVGKVALDQLIDRKVMLIEAHRMDITAGDDEVSRAVRENPSFRDAQGNFSKQVYAEVLKMNNLTPKEFEQSLREDLTLDKFRNMVRDSVLITEDELKRFYKDQQEAQGKAFDEKLYAENRENVFRTMEGINREKALTSVINNLKSGMDIEIYPEAQSSYAG